MTGGAIEGRNDFAVSSCFTTFVAGIGTGTGAGAGVGVGAVAAVVDFFRTLIGDTLGG